MQERKLIKYLSNSKVDEYLPLSVDNKIKLHWSNWKKSTDQIKEFEKMNPKRILSIETDLDQKRHEPVWLRNRVGSLKTTHLSLYESYADPKFQQGWHSRTEEILVSFGNEAGPFLSLAGMRWFDKDTYSKVVYKKLLSGLGSQRSFRVNSDFDFFLCPKEAEHLGIQFKIEQLCPNGILVKLPVNSKIFEWKNDDLLEFRKMSGSYSLMTEEWLCLFDKLEISADTFLDSLAQSLDTRIQSGAIYYFVGLDKLHFDMNKRERYKEMLSDIYFNLDNEIKIA